jgi:hypothetical protein
MSYNGGTSTRIHPMANVDAWAVAPDGRVAIVHSSPYQIEWVAAGGARTRGPVVTYQKVPVTAEERAAELKAEQSKQSMFNGMSAAEAGIQRTAPTYDKWPEFTPPFRSLFIRVSPEGNLWVERWRAAKDSIPTFDVFDARGVRIDRVALPPRARLIGVGAGTVYIARVDADDLQYLQRVRIR